MKVLKGIMPQFQHGMFDEFAPDDIRHTAATVLDSISLGLH